MASLGAGAFAVCAAQEGASPTYEECYDMRQAALAAHATYADTSVFVEKADVAVAADVSTTTVAEEAPAPQTAYQPPSPSMQRLCKTLYHLQFE